ncbi:MAG: hypothetical protein P4M11_13370 [Candidatus Pacebacteria bacterium]|nr:hypothetical protein [Candidatus Paceibacterota bacterium]
MTDKLSHIYLLKHDEGLYSDYRYKVVDFDSGNLVSSIQNSSEHLERDRGHRNPAETPCRYSFPR